MRLSPSLGAPFTEKIQEQWKAATGEKAQTEFLKDLAEKIKKENPQLTKEQAALLAKKSVTPTPAATTTDFKKYIVPAAIGVAGVGLLIYLTKQFK